MSFSYHFPVTASRERVLVKTEETACVVTPDLLAIRFTDFAMIKPLRCLRVILEGAVHGVHDPIAAHLQHVAQQSGRAEVPAGRDVDVLAQVVADVAFARNAAGGLPHEMIDPPNV